MMYRIIHIHIHNNNNNNNRLFDCRHTAQSNTILTPATQGSAIYRTVKQAKLHAANSAQRLLNRTWLNLVSTHQMTVNALM